MDPALSLHTTVVSMSLLVTSCSKACHGPSPVSAYDSYMSLLVTGCSKACHGPSPVSAYDSSLNEPVGDWL